VYTSGNTQGLLYQAVVPVTMVLSYFVLKQRYRPLQIIGAVVILGGVVTVLLPKFLNGSADVEDRPLFNIIFLLGIIPTALSTIYKELAFNDIELDVNYLQYWVAVWQLLVGFLLIPLNTFKFLGPNSVPWDQLPSAIWNGLRCLHGTNTVLLPNCCIGDACKTSPFPPVRFEFLEQFTQLLLLFAINAQPYGLFPV
jgi:drug/metabolite transporter (DMT)-like permease